MSIDNTLWRAWPVAAVAGSGSCLYRVDAAEGIKGSEYGANSALSATINNTTDYVEFTLDIHPGTVILANTLFFVSVYARTGSSSIAAKVDLVINGTTTYSATTAAFTTSASAKTVTINVTSQITASTIVVRVFRVTGAVALYVSYLHDSTHFGIDTGTTNVLNRSAPTVTPSSYGSHEAPVPVAGPPTIALLTLAHAYPDDTLHLNKYSDTLRTSDHSTSGLTTQDVGTDVSSETDSFPTTKTRAITFQADATRKPDAITNTYYTIELKNSAGTSRGVIQTRETLLNVQRPILTSLNGTSSDPVIVNELEPKLTWTDPNDGTTHWRVKVYRASDDAEMFDSTETAAGETFCVIPSSANLASLTTYYAVLSIMKGSGGSDWQVSPLANGYFQIDFTATAVKITSHEGSSDTPQVITDDTPTIEWTFPRTQHSFNLTVIDESDQSVHYNSGWLVSATKSHTIPGGSALTAGGNFSVQVQLKDSQQNHIYSSDKRAWLHVNDASVAAPSLTAEADCTSADSITLEWTAPSTTDNDDLTYEVELTWTSGSESYTETYDADDDTSLVIGRKAAGTISWRVRATDEHSMVGSWSTADSFAVTTSGALPVVTLNALAASYTTTPLTTWSVYDADGDAQTDYEVEISALADFSVLTQDSGVVASTDFHYQHAALAAGTWYRRVRVRTASTDWSNWADDSFTIVAQTSQTTLWELYTDAEGTPTLLSATSYPVTDLSVTRRLDGPTEFSFTVNNFAGTEIIDDDEDMLLYLMDTNGKRVEFRGEVQSKSVGLLCEIRCADISHKFNKWKVEIERDHATLASVISDMIANPTGAAATNIVTHVEEVLDPEEDGQALVMKEFRGQGKTVANWLSEFAQQTGYRWYCECLSNVWHFHWFNPANCPTWSVTLRDDIDYEDESATQWRVLDGAKIEKSRAEYANRIKFNGWYEPPELPPEYATWDDIWCESTSLWGAYSNVTIGADASDVAAGTKSITLTYQITGAAGGTIVSRRGIDLGYFKLPSMYRDLANNFFDAFRFKTKCHWTIDGSNFVWGYPSASADGTYGQVMGFCTAFSGSKVGPTGGVKLNENSWFFPNMLTDRDTHESVVPASWLATETGIALRESSSFDINNVNAIGLSLVFPYNSGYPDIVVPEGSVFVAKLWVDDLKLVCVNQNEKPSTGTFFVETSAVTAGTEVPIEAELMSNTGMTQSEARKLALMWLDIKSRTKLSVKNVAVASVRNVPYKIMVPIVLTQGPVLSSSYSLSEVTWKVGENGWSTELVLGDMPTDHIRTLERLRHGLASLKAEMSHA